MKLGDALRHWQGCCGALQHTGLHAEQASICAPALAWITCVMLVLAVFSATASLY